MTFQDIKNKQIPLSTATLVAIVFFFINASVWFATSQANMERDIIDNKKKSEMLMQEIQKQDDKIEHIKDKVSEFNANIDVINTNIKSIAENIKELKNTRR